MHVLTAPIRVTILTGFLGAGKTTLLNRLLADPQLRDTAVIVNEFGEIGIDHLLVEAPREDIVELSDGCVCCTVRGELVDTLADLVDRIETGRLRPLRRVVIETSGLADPSPVIAALIAHPALVSAYALASVVCVVDARAGLAGLKGRLEAERQIACADRIVLTKTEIGGGADEGPLLAWIAALNPRAHPIAASDIPPTTLLEAGIFDASSGRPDVPRWLGADAGHERHHHHHHHHHMPHAKVRSVSLTEETPIARAALEGFLDLLSTTQGERILRMKGIVRTLEAPDRPLVLHGVRGYLHPPAHLASWPEGMAPHSRLVVIGEGLDERHLRDLFAAFTDRPRLDAPDRAALTDNPLAIAGFR